MKNLILSALIMIPTAFSVAGPNLDNGQPSESFHCYEDTTISTGIVVDVFPKGDQVTARVILLSPEGNAGFNASMIKTQEVLQGEEYERIMLSFADQQKFELKTPRHKIQGTGTLYSGRLAVPFICEHRAAY